MDRVEYAWLLSIPSPFIVDENNYPSFIVTIILFLIKHMGVELRNSLHTSLDKKGWRYWDNYALISEP